MTNNPIINAIGVAVPQNRISQEHHLSILQSANGMNREEQLQLRSIYTKSGITSRHSVLGEFAEHDKGENLLFHPGTDEPGAPVSKRMFLFEKYAADLCVQAITNCVEEIPHFEIASVTHLITFSCTGMFAPGLDIQLIEKLNLNRNIERTCINFMGCYAGISALKTAYHITRSNPDAIVLLAGVELCTLHYQKSKNQDQLIANAIFSDGAAACIVSSKKYSTEKEPLQLSLETFYSEFEPSGNKDMVWSIGDFGFDLRLSTYVPDLIKQSIQSLLTKLFLKAGIKNSDIDFYALHPGGRKILEACEEALHITKEQNAFSYDILSEYGNMSSVTIFFVLRKYLSSLTSADKNKKILTCGFGPGLTIEAVILKIV